MCILYCIAASTGLIMNLHFPTKLSCKAIFTIVFIVFAIEIIYKARMDIGILLPGNPAVILKSGPYHPRESQAADICLLNIQRLHVTTHYLQSTC